MVDFSLLLSPAQRQRLAKTAAELERIFSLPDRWLAEELLRLARGTRAMFPDKLAYDPRLSTYDRSLVWDVVPEVAKRLGSRNLTEQEASFEVRAHSGTALREHAGQCLHCTSINRWLDHQANFPSPAELLVHDIPNGNPLAIAVDRLCPAPPREAHADDWIARHVREISRTRGFQETAIWTPALQHWRS